MKIPRYDSSVGLINSGRSLTTGTAGTSAMAESGNIALNAIRAYADSKVKLTAKLRDLEIQTKHANASNATVTAQNDLLFDIEDNNRTDYNNWAKEWQKKMDDLKKERQKTMDEHEWSLYQPKHDIDFTNGLELIRKKVTDTKLKLGEIAYVKEGETFQDKVAKATTSQEVITAFTEIKTSMDAKKNIDFIGGERYQTDYTKFEGVANERLAYLQVNKNAGILPVKAPNGISAPNWEDMASAAENPEIEITDVNGRKLAVESPERQALIKFYREKDKEQDAFFKQEKDAKDDKTKTEFANRAINVLINKKPDPKFYEDLKNSDLSSTDKTTLENAYTTNMAALTSGATDTWKTQEGYTAQIYLDGLIYMGAIDNRAEGRKVVESLALRGYLDPTKTSDYYRRIDANIKSRNQYKNMLIRDAIKTVVTEVGGQTATLDFSALKDASLSNNPTALANALNSVNGKWTMETKRAVENLFDAIKEGEKKGFSYTNMLDNANSDNYVLGDIVNIYKGKTIEAKKGQLQADVNAYISQSINNNKLVIDTGVTYRLDAEKWANSTIRDDPSQPDIDVPPIKDGETIDQYQKRIDKDKIMFKDADTTEALSIFVPQYGN